MLSILVRSNITNFYLYIARLPSRNAPTVDHRACGTAVLFVRDITVVIVFRGISLLSY
jgi:hypothetical protein